MSEMKYLKFSSKGKKARVLSNFAELSVVVNGREYKTGEHAFHGNKYSHMTSNMVCSDLFFACNNRHSRVLSSR